MLPLLAALILTAPAPDDPKPDAPSAMSVVEAIESVMIDAIAKAEASVVAIDRTLGENSERTLAVRGRNPAGAGPRGFIDPHLPPGMIDLRLTDPRDTAISFDYGSGVVIGERGEILTAFSVVQGASRLRVKSPNRRSFEAEVVAADPRSDLAVIAPREGLSPAELGLKPIRMGDATKLRKGSLLIALGNPYNAARDGKASASWGILSNFARKIEPFPSEPQLRHYPTLLQLDTKLNLGMSGGAVVDIRGELVGLTTTAANAGGFDSQAGYAIPLDRLGLRIVRTLLEGREAEYGFLGIQLSPDGSSRVAGSSPNSPAALGGLVVNDEIVTIDGIPVDDGASLVAAVNSFEPGKAIEVGLRRNEAPLTKSVILAKFPVRGEVIATNRPPSWRGIHVDYLSILPNAEFGGVLFDMMKYGGVAVREVDPGSPAADAGLQPGQVITMVSGKRLDSPQRFREFVKGLEGKIQITTNRGQTVEIADDKQP
ncbi:MAG: trypsin-like peptidase domain-containing protein [Isosphaeraceae bacterium]|nr:trypsin-like peptidase domain-containing protein [Isosphaeraceae bacterium]